MTKPINVLGRVVIVEQNHILAVKKKDYYFLPGGHVEYNEGLKETITRECVEEFSGEVKVTDFMGIIENSFDEGDGTPYHELGFLFKGELTNTNFPEVPKSNEEDLTCEWLDLGKIDEYNLLPTPIKGFLKENMEKTSSWVSTMEQ